MPLDSSWIVRWSRFFEIGGSRPNFSRRIDQSSANGLGNDVVFPAIDQTNRVGLLYRDLLGATLAGLWSVDALIAEIAVRPPAPHRHVTACLPIVAGAWTNWAPGWPPSGLSAG